MARDCNHLKPQKGVKMSRQERGRKMHQYICCKHPTLKTCGPKREKAMNRPIGDFKK